MSIPILLGLPLTIWGGMLLFMLIVLQILTGKRIIKAPPAYHRITAIGILVLGLFHAVAGIGTWLGWFAVG